jgi:hypothetical protein
MKPLRFPLAAALAATGYIHADLYLNGYRVIPVVGPSFLWLASGCFAVALLLLFTNSLVLRLAAAALAAGAIGGFVMSRTVGIFGFVEHGWLPAPQAALSVLAETAALALLAVQLVATRRQAGLQSSVDLA